MLNVPKGAMSGTMYAGGESVELKGIQRIDIDHDLSDDLYPWRVTLHFDAGEFAMREFPRSLTFFHKINGRNEIAIFDRLMPEDPVRYENMVKVTFRAGARADGL